MSLSQDDKREINEAVQEGFKQALKDQGLDIASHAQDHQFVSEFRKNVGQVKSASIWITVTTGVAGILALIWMAITGRV